MSVSDLLTEEHWQSVLKYAPWLYTAYTKWKASRSATPAPSARPAPPANAAVYIANSGNVVIDDVVSYGPGPVCHFEGIKNLTASNIRRKKSR